MFKYLTTFLLFAPGLAFADEVPLQFDAPAEVGMFESARLVDGKGKVKGGTCEEAMALAVEDALGLAERKNHPTVVAMYDERPSDGWTSASAVTCEIKGKNTLVKIEALAVRPGEDAAYAPVTAARTTEIVDAFVDESSVVGMQVQALDIEAFKGGLYYNSRTSRDDVFGSDDNRNTRAVTVYREEITPRLAYLSGLVQPVPEIAGLHVSTAAKRYDKGEEKSESFHLFVPSDAALSFVNGDITEQELVNAGSFMYADGTSQPVKMDISFVDAAD